MENSKKRIIFVIIFGLFLFTWIHSENSFGQTMVVKEVCLSSFGMNWKTAEEAKIYVTSFAKREAAGEIFGEFIRSITQVEKFQLKKDEILLYSSGFIRIKGTTEFYNGNGYGEICVKISAYVTDEDIIRFKPREVNKKVCVADPRLSLGEVRQTAERQARIQAVKDFEPKLEKIEDDIILTLIHESKTLDGGFVPDTTTYCTTARGVVYPIELTALIDSKKASQISEVDKVKKERQNLIGIWKGKGCQSNSSCWTIHISIPSFNDDVTGGMIAYPSLNCEAKLEFVRWEGNTGVFRERYIRRGSCVPDGWLWLTPLKSGRVQFIWGFPDGRKDAWTEVTRGDR